MLFASFNFGIKESCHNLICSSLAPIYTCLETSPVLKTLSLARILYKNPQAAHQGQVIVTPAFSTINKSPNKSCVFSKLTRRAQLPFKP
jgi:hypothetical protein